MSPPFNKEGHRHVTPSLGAALVRRLRRLEPTPLFIKRRYGGGKAINTAASGATEEGRRFEVVRRSTSSRCPRQSGTAGGRRATPREEFFEGLDDDDDEDDGALRLAVSIGLPLLGEPEAPGLLPLVIKDLNTGEAPATGILKWCMRR